MLATPRVSGDDGKPSCGAGEAAIFRRLNRRTTRGASTRARSLAAATVGRGIIPSIILSAESRFCVPPDVSVDTKTHRYYTGCNAASTAVSVRQRSGVCLSVSHAVITKSSTQLSKAVISWCNHSVVDAASSTYRQRFIRIFLSGETTA